MNNLKKNVFEIVVNELINQINVYFVDRIYREIAIDESFQNSDRILKFYRDMVRVVVPIIGSEEAQKMQTEFGKKYIKVQKNYLSARSDGLVEMVLFDIIPIKVPYKITDKIWNERSDGTCDIKHSTIKEIAYQYIQELVTVLEDLIVNKPEGYTCINIKDFSDGLNTICRTIVNYQAYLREYQLFVDKRPGFIDQMSYIQTTRLSRRVPIKNELSKIVNDVIYIIGNGSSSAETCYSVLIDPVYKIDKLKMKKYFESINSIDPFFNIVQVSKYFTYVFNEGYGEFANFGVISIYDKEVSDTLNDEYSNISDEEVRNDFCEGLLHIMTNRYACHITKNHKIVIDHDKSIGLSDEALQHGAISGIAMQIFKYWHSLIMIE